MSKEDDSQVVKVYETLAGVSVSGQSTNSNSAGAKEGDDVGDLWVFPDGTKEEILEVAAEARHNLVLENEYTRVLKVRVSDVSVSFWLNSCLCEIHFQFVILTSIREVPPKRYNIRSPPCRG